MSESPLRVIAHRGFSGLFPENTRPSFQAALQMKVDSIEFDVRLLKDGMPVVIHDSTVDRTTDGTGKVEDMVLDQVKQLDAGSWFAPSFGGIRVLTLAETLDLLAGRVRLNIHIKTQDHDRKAIVSSVLSEIKERRLMGNAYLASDEATLIRARVDEPELALCNLTTEPLGTYIRRSLSLGCRILQPPNAGVEEAHENSMEVNPFYADDPTEMTRLVAAGVDGILTNYPDRLLRLRATL
jgi:glycerophosphoryl diester phosphodiesterase